MWDWARSTEGSEPRHLAGSAVEHGIDIDINGVSIDHRRSIRYRHVLGCHLGRVGIVANVPLGVPWKKTLPVHMGEEVDLGHALWAIGVLYLNARAVERLAGVMHLLQLVERRELYGVHVPKLALDPEAVPWGVEHRGTEERGHEDEWNTEDGGCRSDESRLSRAITERRVVLTMASE